MGISANLRTEVLLSGPCAYCADPVPTQVDHIMPRSRGGSDDRENLAPACKCCNMEKLDFTPEEYRAYREEQGLSWPPQSMFDFIKELLAEAREKYGDEEVERAIRHWMTAQAADTVAARDAGRIEATIELRAATNADGR